MSLGDPIWDRRNGFIGLLLFILLLVGMTWANYRFVGAPRYVQRDFMSLWGGGRALLEGTNPYDPELWNPLRERYGSSWFPESMNLYPVWTLLVMLPVSALEFGWGAALWITINQLMLLTIIFALAVRLGPRKPSLKEFTFIAFGVVTFRASLVTLHNGQFTIILLFTLTMCLLFYKHDHRFLAGFCLSCIIWKPNAFILVAPLTVVWMIWRREWKILASGFVGLIFWVAISWIVLPGWIFDWIKVAGLREVTFITPTVWGVAGFISNKWAPVFGLVLTIGISALVGWIIFRFPVLDFSYVLALGIAASLLIMPYGWAYEHVYLIIPLSILVIRIRRRWAAMIIWFTMIVAMPWSMYWLSNTVDSAVPETAVPALTFLILIVFLVSDGAKLNLEADKVHA